MKRMVLPQHDYWITPYEILNGYKDTEITNG